jgi:methionine--tRNA ligase beta chain
MVDPRVLEKAGIDPNKYSGFAAGFGVERFAMIIHGIKDLREFVKSDKRFLKQFPHFYDDGLVTFLQGKDGTIQPHQEPEDLRTEQIPSTIVESMEDLRSYQYETILEDDSPQNDHAADSTKLPQQTKQQQQDPPMVPPSEKNDISKLDIRVGLIQKVWEHPEADKLYCEEIDLGEDTGPRQIASGLKAHYSLEEMENRKVLVLANLKTRKLMNFPSHGMVLCASSEDGSKVELIEPPIDAAVGERVFVEGYGGEPATENQVIKKKMLEAIFPDLKTNSERIATYKGQPFQTSAGVCKAKTLANVPIA